MGLVPVRCLWRSVSISTLTNHVAFSNGTMRDFKPPFAAGCRCRSQAFGLAGCFGRQPTTLYLACCIGDRYTAVHKHHPQRKRMEKSKYANMTVKKIQGLLRAKGAKLDGRKHDLITRWDKTPGKIRVGYNGVRIWAGPLRAGIPAGLLRYWSG